MRRNHKTMINDNNNQSKILHNWCILIDGAFACAIQSPILTLTYIYYLIQNETATSALITSKKLQGCHKSATDCANFDSNTGADLLGYYTLGIKSKMFLTTRNKTEQLAVHIEIVMSGSKPARPERPKIRLTAEKPDGLLVDRRGSLFDVVDGNSQSEAATATVLRWSFGSSRWPCECSHSKWQEEWPCPSPWIPCRGMRKTKKWTKRWLELCDEPDGAMFFRSPPQRSHVARRTFGWGRNVWGQPEEQGVRAGDSQKKAKEINSAVILDWLHKIW